jgi:hypothetical protein
VQDRALLWLASGAAAVCPATGVAWAAAPAPTPVRIFLLGILVGTALYAVAVVRAWSAIREERGTVAGTRA